MYDQIQIDVPIYEQIYKYLASSNLKFPIEWLELLRYFPNQQTQMSAYLYFF